MPIDTRHVLTGTLGTSAAGVYTLQADGGGVWQLDVGLGWRARRLVGRRVTVIGTRAGFDMLDVIRMQEIEPRPRGVVSETSPIDEGCSTGLLKARDQLRHLPPGDDPTCGAVEGQPRNQTSDS